MMDSWRPFLPHTRLSHCEGVGYLYGTRTRSNKQCMKWNDSDLFFDRFNIGLSGDGRNLITGSYQNTFHVFLE